MPGDQPPPDNVEADGVTTDDDGYIVLDSAKAQFDFLWIADDLNYSVGFVSKVRTTPFPTEPYYREVGRYVSVTCFSDPVRGSTEGAVLGQTPPGGLCADGMHGCCSRDEVTPGPNGGHQAVQLIANRPSRTAVDINGDVWVSNRAHWWSGYNQASVTKIANNLKDCIDRNGNGVIDTSSDLNNDGIITTDCDDNNLPDSYATTCVPGKFHEFYGLDDECILFTVNTQYGGTGRPIALGPGEGGPTDPSDAWAGMYSTGTFYRVDGKTGEIKTTVQVAPSGAPVASRPYGAAVDQFGILWAPNIDNGGLFYFDTNSPANQGMVYAPALGGSQQFYGIAIDGFTVPDPVTSDPVLVQQIWLGQWGGVSGAGVWRYRPVRDQGFTGLGNGTWAHVTFNARGRGVGVDNRTPTAYAWMALYDFASIGRVPTDIPDGNHNYASGPPNSYSTLGSETIGTGVAFDGDVWAVNYGSSNVSHFSVDDQGTVLGPADVVNLDDSCDANGQNCKAEGFCGQSYCKPHPYTYSDFTGFGLRNFTNPQGFYSWVETAVCPPGEATFLYVSWDGETPPGTAITMIARSANDPESLDSAQWTDQYHFSPADLSIPPGPLSPNPASYIEVLFELTSDGGTTPKLKSFEIVYECEQKVPR